MRFRRTLLSAATVVLVAAGGVVGVSGPAQAIDPGTIATIATAAYQTYSALEHFNGAPDDLQQATAAIIDAVNQARAAIVNEIDAVAAANVESCKDSALADVENLPAMSSTALESYASNATNCVTLAKNFIDTFGDLNVVNEVGFALNTVAPLALIARDRQGSTSVVLKQQIIAANQSIVSRLVPHCTSVRFVDHGGPFWNTSCTAFNGTSAKSVVFQAPLDFTALTSVVTRSTAYDESFGLLPMLTETPHTGTILSGNNPPACLDVANPAAPTGSEVRPLACNGGSGQQWTVNAGGNTIRALGRCLDVSGGSAAAGTPVGLWNCNGTGAQRWVRTSAGELLSPFSGLCLDGSHGLGVHLQLAVCTGYSNQRWTLPT
jgi:hypothetical protein